MGLFACYKLPCESCSHWQAAHIQSLSSWLSPSLSPSRRAHHWQVITSKSRYRGFEEGIFLPLQCSVTSIKFFLILTAPMVKQNITPVLRPRKLLPKAVRIKFPSFAWLCFICVMLWWRRSEQEGNVHRNHKCMIPNEIYSPLIYDFTVFGLNEIQRTFVEDFGR